MVFKKYKTIICWLPKKKGVKLITPIFLNCLSFILSKMSNIILDILQTLSKFVFKFVLTYLYIYILIYIGQLK